MKDRISNKPGRRLITPENGANAFYATIAHADDPVQEGTPLNRSTLLSDATAQRLGLSSSATPNDAFDKLSSIVNTIYPVGSIYMTTNSANPSAIFGGTWVAWGSGRVPVGVDTAQTEFNTVEKTGGAKSVVLVRSNLPSGTLVFTTRTTWSTGAWGPHPSPDTAGSFPLDANGGFTSTEYNQGHNNLQPYITCYMWRRTA